MITPDTRATFFRPKSREVFLAAGVLSKRLQVGRCLEATYISRCRGVRTNMEGETINKVYQLFKLFRWKLCQLLIDWWKTGQTVSRDWRKDGTVKGNFDRVSKYGVAGSAGYRNETIGYEWIRRKGKDGNEDRIENEEMETKENEENGVDGKWG